MALSNLFKRRNKSSDDDEVLFDGDDREFKECIRQANVYFEYGCGASTMWVSRNSKAQIFGIDTSSEWIEKTKAAVSSNNSVNLTHVELGPLGEWGRPLTYQYRNRISAYTDHHWGSGVKPDVVLIDGRFRVCCFFTSLINATEGTKLFFDDYSERPLYHVVEEYAGTPEFCGRQAIFEVPQLTDPVKSEIQREIINFRYVID